MPGFRSRSSNASPVWLADDDGNPAALGATGAQPAASSQSVTPASDGSAFPVNQGGIASSSRPAAGTAGQRVNAYFRLTGEQVIMPSFSSGNLFFEDSYNSDNKPGLGGSYLGVISYPVVYDGTNCQRTRGDITGTWTHSPASAASTALSGTISASGGTAAITMTNTTRTEVINPSTGTLWASWGTPAVNGAGSFPITAGSSYSPPDRSAGTLTLLSTAATQPYTVNRFS